MTDKLSRRDLLLQTAALGTLGLVATSAACSKPKPPPLSCTDTTALTPTDLMIRNSLGYVDASMEPNKFCSNCIQFIPASPDACGACKVVKGPINPNGYCKSFSPKPAPKPA
jgi:hypothetical protein